MSKAVDPVPTPGDLQSRAPAPQPQPQIQPATPAAGSAAPEAGGEPDIRLTIEPALHGLGYVYRITDRTSGMVIAELPREAVKAKARDGSYSVGDIVDTKA